MICIKLINLYQDCMSLVGFMVITHTIEEVLSWTVFLSWLSYIQIQIHTGEIDIGPIFHCMFAY